MLSDLTIGQQQLVATARASKRGTRFLIFDEPTGYLTCQESEQLFALINRLKASGVTIVYISHRLEEVFRLCDRVSILRDGALVSTQKVSETNEEKLIVGMINRAEGSGSRMIRGFARVCLRTSFYPPKGQSHFARSFRSKNIIGGEGSVTIVKQFGLAGKMTFISTGGGVSVELLKGITRRTFWDRMRS